MHDEPNISRVLLEEQYHVWKGTHRTLVHVHIEDKAIAPSVQNDSLRLRVA